MTRQFAPALAADSPAISRKARKRRRVPTFARRGVHVLAVKSAQTWAVEHPAECRDAGGPEACDVQAAARAAFSAKWPIEVGRYIVDASGSGGELAILDEFTR